MEINTKYVEKIIEGYQDQIKEKIAFSLFAMFYYKHNFCFEQDEYLNKMKFEKIKQMWKLGKMKKKLKKFFSLADQVFEMDLNNKDKNDENSS